MFLFGTKNAARTPSLLALLRFIVALVILAAPAGHLWACACGCGLFDVGTGALLPSQEGGTAYLEYDLMNQDRNWHGTSKAAAEDNEDRGLLSQFVTAGTQVMFNRSWGAMLDVPFVDRRLRAEDDDGNEVTFRHASIGDVRLRGAYTGFSSDMSTGLTFGAKLPTGHHKLDGFDRDTQIGSGSTDLLLGLFHRGALPGAASLSWFFNTQVDAPVLITPAYRPGTENDSVLGIACKGWRLGGVKIAPIAQALESVRGKDTGGDADPANTGYERTLLSPGLELSADAWRLYGDAAFPVRQWVRGDQIVAPVYLKLIVGRRF